MATGWGNRGMALFALVMGASIIGLWALLLATGQAPELESAPIRFAGHLAAEGVTALALLAAAYGLLAGRAWAIPLYLVATGLLLYAMLQALGYYLAQGEMIFVAMFSLFTLLALILLFRAIARRRRQLMLVMLGLFAYTTLQTTGYFLQVQEWNSAVMFGLLLLLTLVATGARLRQGAQVR
jgi:hypothetical protein